MDTALPRYADAIHAANHFALRQRVEALAFVRDLDDLAGKHAEAQRWFGACIERLQTLGPGSGLPVD